MNKFHHLAKTLAPFIVCIFFSAGATAVPIAGVESGVAERGMDTGLLLSQQIAALESECAARAQDAAQEKYDGKEVSDEKFAKKRNKEFFKCLKKGLKSWKKADALDKQEEKALQKAVKTARKLAKNSSGDGGDGDGDGDPGDGGVAELSGEVASTLGGLLSGVEVAAESEADFVSVESNELGTYQLQLMPGEQYVVTYRGAGLADQVRLVTAGPDASSQVQDVLMFPRSLPQPATTGEPVIGADGTMLELLNADGSASQFVNDEDQPVAEVLVSITPFDMSNREARVNLPGDRADLVFRSLVEFHFTDSLGNPVQLADGQTALIRLPMYETLDENQLLVTAGASMTTYNLNEASGQWEQEAIGAVVSDTNSPRGLAVESRVGHFSFKAAIPGSGAPYVENFIGFPASGTVCLDLELLNSGGSAQSYQLTPRDSGNLEVVILPGTSVLKVSIPDNNDYNYWDSDLVASNGTGSSTRQMFIDNEGFDFDDLSDAYLACP